MQNHADGKKQPLLLFLDGGVVLITLLATAINGCRDPFLTLLIITVLAFVARIIGMLIAESGD